jgi:hypothetical protein
MTHFCAEGKRTLHIASRSSEAMVGTAWGGGLQPPRCRNPPMENPPNETCLGFPTVLRGGRQSRQRAVAFWENPGEHRGHKKFPERGDVFGVFGRCGVLKGTPRISTAHRVKMKLGLAGFSGYAGSFLAHWGLGRQELTDRLRMVGSSLYSCGTDDGLCTRSGLCWTRDYRLPRSTLQGHDTVWDTC